MPKFNVEVTFFVLADTYEDAEQLVQSKLDDAHRATHDSLPKFTVAWVEESDA